MLLRINDKGVPVNMVVNNVVKHQPFFIDIAVFVLFVGHNAELTAAVVFDFMGHVNLLKRP